MQNILLQLAQDMGGDGLDHLLASCGELMPSIYRWRTLGLMPAI